MCEEERSGCGVWGLRYNEVDVGYEKCGNDWMGKRERERERKRESKKREKKYTELKW